MNKAMMLYLFLFLVPLSIEDGKKNEMNQDIVSLALDLIKLIGDSKGLKEAISGIDSATGKNLTSSERLSSILNAFPFEKYSKNGKRFLQAAEKARKLGKIEKALYFAKSAVRAYKKAKVFGNDIKSGIKKVYKVSVGANTKKIAFGNGIKSKIKNVEGAFNGAKAFGNGIKSKIKKVEGVYKEAKAVGNGIKNRIKKVEGAFKEAKAVGNGIKNGIKKVEGVFKKTKAVGNGIKNGLKKVEGAVTKTKVVGNGIINGIRKVAGDNTIKKAVGNGIKNGVEKVNKAIKFLVNKEDFIKISKT